MCIPYIEQSPPRKSSPTKRPTKKPQHGAIPIYSRLHGYGGYRGMHDMFHGTDHGINPFMYRPPGLGQFPYNGQYQGGPQWPLFNQAVTGHGIHHPYGQPYTPGPQMMYTIPQERRDFSGPNYAEPSIRNPGSMEVYRPNRKQQRHHLNESSPVVILHTSDGRGRSRHRGRDRSHRHHTRGASRYSSTRGASSSVDSSLYGHRRPRYRRSLSM